MKTTKQLLKELEDKSAFHLAWSVIWRFYVLFFVVYLALSFVFFALIGLASL